ncbi:MAG TPA: Ig-like domain-containing protein [Candidatus Nanoarchaeia archaeon]|nr:Ig-like domain-containing protein [Candidatus Nanoarchaeia archaeon]
MNLQAPGNDTFRNNNSTQFNYTPIDNNLASCILYANFTAPFGPNQTHSNPVSGSINTFGPINLTDGKYLWNVWCNDSAGNSNFSQYNYTVKIDVHHPVISDWARNGTGFPVNSYICLNVSVTDNFAGVQTVYAEVQNPNSIIANYTLLDNGAGCDAAGGDNIYSVSYYNEFAGNYTWINTYAKDYSNNWHTNLTNLTWNATSTGSMTVLMVYPSSSIEINESEYNYQYQQTCNVSCDAGGVNCENITLYAQYQPLAVFFNINTTTTDLINAEDNFSCGSLVAGGAPCTHTFNITSGTNSGNHTWPIRCSATSESIGTFVSSSVNLIINDHPHANFTYPANNAWLGGVEMLNASASFDSDGTITNYWFEYDNNTAFNSPSTICNSSSINCTWNTSQQNQCDNNTLACYLRLIITDDNGLTNSTYITVGFDTQGPTTTLDLPRNSENISSNSFSVNATASDGQVGVHTVTFEYRQNDTDSWHFACSDSAGPPYNCTWDLTSLPDRATYEFRAYSNDSKGNTGSVNTHTNISLNRSAPVITLISPPDNSTDTDGYIIFTYQVAAFNPIINCSLIINNNRNQTNDSVQRGQNQYFYLSNVPDGSQLNWSINCTDTSYRINFSDTWNVTVAINTNMNLSLLLDKSSYYIGEVAVITNNVTEPSGSGISSVDVSTAIVLANTTIPWWNSSWQRRKPIILNSSSSLTNVMVEVNITGLSGNITGCANEIMIVRFNSSTALLTNVNRTIVGGDNANYCVVRFRANITAGVNNTEFMAYYNNSGATNPNNNESWQTLNSTKTAISGSILGSQYNVNSGSYSNTTSDDNSYYGVGRDNSPPTGQPLNAFLNLTYNLSNLGVPESSLVSLNFTINYCHSNDVTAPITCGSAIGAGSGTAYVQLYDYDAVGWAAGFDTILQDVNSANEITDTYIETNALDNYVDNSTNMLFVRYETNITGLGKSDDASFALDHAILNVFYKERVYSVGSIGSTQLLVASNSSTTDYQGLWVWNWSTTGISAGNYSTVSLGTKANYNNAYDYFWFEIKPDNVAPIIMLVSPQNNNYTTNNNMTFYFNVSDATSAIANCSLIINGNIVNTTLSPPRDTNLSLRYDLGNGVYNWSVNCTDINNNVNSSEIRNLTIAPALNIALIVVDDNIFIPINEIDLQAGTTKTVYCNMTVTDSEVYTNILGANATLYSTTTAYDSGDSNRTHYTNSSCAFIAGGGQSADYQCIFNVWYFAINGSWNCTGFAWTSSFKVNATGNTTMNQLFALNISTSVIDYTSLEPSQFSPNVTVNISNVGNMPMNISVYGFGGEDEATGTGLSMVCEINNITVSFERFATSPATDYNSKTQLGAAEQDLGLTIPAKTAYDEIRSNSTYWQFMVPAGSQSFGQCNGSVVFVAESP